MTTNYGYHMNATLFNWKINQACEDSDEYSLPVDLRHHLTVQRFSHRVVKVMSGNSDHPFGTPTDGERILLMNLLEREIYDIENNMRDGCTIWTKVTLLSARLYLYTFHFLDSSHLESRNEGILKAYNAATTFITELDKLAILHGPYPTCRAIFTAAAVILKVLNSSLYAIIDSAAGITMLNTAMAVLRRGSVQEVDFCTRAANIISQIWQLFQGPQATPQELPELLVQNSLGANLTFDLLWRWRSGCARANANADSSVAAIPSLENTPIMRGSPPMDELWGQDSMSMMSFDLFDDFALPGLPWNLNGQ